MPDTAPLNGAIEPVARPRPIDEAALDARLAEVRATRNADAVRAEAARTAGTAMGIGFRIGIELVVGVCIGTGGGYALDRWLGTAPWLMIVGLLVGFAAGLRNVFRSADSYGKKWDAADAADKFAAAAAADRAGK